MMDIPTGNIIKWRGGYWKPPMRSKWDFIAARETAFKQRALHGAFHAEAPMLGKCFTSTTIANQLSKGLLRAKGAKRLSSFNAKE
jgi:hypothetical protein